jgi:hypothetical protein
MSDRNLRSGLIRLAYQNPNLRSALLPLLKRAGDGDDMAAVLDAEADPTSHDQNLPEHYYYGKTAASERYRVIESKRWVNKMTGATASVYGAVPWSSGADKPNWSVETVGWTVEDMKNGTVGIGRPPWKSKSEAQRWADEENERLAEIAAMYARRSAGGKTAEERLANIEKLLSQFASPASKNQNKPESYYGLPPKGKTVDFKVPKGKQASVGRTAIKTASGSGAANAAYLRQSPLKNKILQAVAKHYGVSVSEIEAELTDPDAEALYEYIGNDRALAMAVYRDMKAKGL